MSATNRETAIARSSSVECAPSLLLGAPELQRNFLANTPECIKIVAPDGTLLDINEAGVRLVEAESAKDLLGKSVYHLVAPEDREAFRALNERVCAGNKESLEFEIIGLKGTRGGWRQPPFPLPIRTAAGISS